MDTSELDGRDLMVLQALPAALAHMTGPGENESVPAQYAI